MSEHMGIDRIRQLLRYCPDSGAFTWLVSRGAGAAKVAAGDAAGTGSRGFGYWCIGIDGRRYQAHRLAFALMTERWPEQDVDHIDGDRMNNRWANLRQLGRSQNNENVIGANANNKLGLRGVSKTGGTFFARIQVNKQLRYLGSYATEQEAHGAYLKAKAELHVAARRGFSVPDNGSPKATYRRGPKA